MPRFKLTIEYAGTRFSGWQIQKNARTVQGEIDHAVAATEKSFIRLTLGASPAGLTRLVLGQSLRIVGTGVAIGVLLSLATSRLLVRHLLSGCPDCRTGSTRGTTPSQTLRTSSPADERRLPRTTSGG